MRKRLGLLAATVVVAAAVPWLAWANHADLYDPDDTKGLLDVRRVEVGGTEQPTWQVFTFRRWSPAQVFDSGYVLVHLDTFGSERYDYYALLRSNGRRMLGTLVRDRVTKPDFNVAKVSAWKPTADSVKTRVPLEILRVGDSRLTYRWEVETIFTNDFCRRVCFDLVPDVGGAAEPVPGAVEPTPSVSPSPVLTVTPSP